MFRSGFMIVFFAGLLGYLLYLVLKYRKCFYMLQQNSYNVSNRYLKWIFKNFNKVFVTRDILFLFVYLLYFVIPFNYFVVFINVFYLFMFYMELNDVKVEQGKKPFVVTSRVKRLIFTLVVIFGLMSAFCVVNYSKSNVNYYYLMYALFGYLAYIVSYIVNIINMPIEKCVYYYYKNMALTKLNSMSNLKKIGITGSYGKTTSKNILNDILNMRYNSFATPKSFNTPYGLMNSINNNLDKFDDVFIAEMGACKKGDITELCKFIKPKYGIITKIGMAHLETFKSIENTVCEKFRLVEMLPSDGVCVLNRDDEFQRNYKIKNDCKVIWIGIDNSADVMASNIKIDSTGMSFDVTFYGKDKYNFKTNILGRANIYNILAGSAMGECLGVSIEDIKNAVSRLKPTEHRLELKKYNDNLTIIDDAFNSNPEGSKMALEVLSLMNGYKIVVTPGMIELGSMQDELNFNFGEYISEVSDMVILVGENQTKPIYNGLINKGYNEDNIYVINDVKEAFKIINKLNKKNMYVLLENDLPDIFNES